MPIGNFNLLESPILVYALAAFAIGLVIFGIMFAVRSLREVEEEKTAVPISDVADIKKFPQEERPSLRPVTESNPNLARHLVEENLSAAPAASSDSLKHEVKLLKEELLEQEKVHGEKIKQLEDALKRELASKDKLAVLETENHEIRALKEKSAKSAEAVSRLTEENQVLLKTNQSQEALVKKIEEAFGQLKAAHEEIIRQQTAEFTAFKEQFKNAEATAMQLRKATEDLERAADQVKLLQTAVAQRETEIGSLKDQMREAVGAQQTDADQYVEKINALRQELLNVKPVIAREFEQSASQLKAQMEELKIQRNEAVALKEKAHQDFISLKDLNKYLSEKEKLLQYELTKYRAQVLGLEKICEDFKLQLDHLYH